MYKTIEDINKGYKKKDFKPIKDYKPLGNLIYNEELLNKLEDRLNDN